VSRVERLRAAHSYRSVLFLVVASFVFAAAAPDESWTQSVVVLAQSATLAVALWTSGLGRNAVVPSVALAVIGVVAAVVQLSSGSDTSTGATSILDAVLVVAACVVIGLGVSDQREVNRQSALGAISIYLLIGMLFTFVYGAVASLGNGPFFAQGTDGELSLHLYFSFVTLATLGYGDYTAASTFGHTLSVVEAIFGQLYLVTVVAVIVGHIGRRPSSPS
jgi:Ion channel